MKPTSKAMRAVAVLLLAAGLAAPVTMAAQSAHASEIRYIVNNEPVTSYDIQRRVAFLRLQQRRGNLQQIAADEVIDETLRKAEIRRLNITVSDDQVADAYGRFATSNNLSNAQLDQILAQSGVTRQHFRDFIRTQMGWSQAMSARAGATGAQPGMTEQEVARKIIAEGGQKPSATEYLLQQVIFVIPQAERRAKMAARKREAEGVRQRFQNCDTTRQVVAGMLDVTVRDLGRVIEPELPPDWKAPVTSTQAGRTTQVRETDRGAEFIAVCSTREVSDDRVAQMVFESRNADSSADSMESVSNEYTAELRAQANIIQR